ncbi:hypothetical protein [Clostridium sardiniense]|uniref:hypothetical protein n=1 Tax=Clostridium sardiniense TaxID=29369 RepID=UPI003D34B73B
MSNYNLIEDSEKDVILNCANKCILNEKLSKDIEFTNIKGYKRDNNAKSPTFNNGVIKINNKNVQLDLERELRYFDENHFDRYEDEKYFINVLFIKYSDQKVVSDYTKDGGSENIEFDNEDGSRTFGSGIVTSESILSIPNGDMDISKRDEWITNTPSGKILQYNYREMANEALKYGWACCVVSNRILISIRRELLKDIDAYKETNIEKLKVAVSNFLIDKDFYILAKKNVESVYYANHKIYYKLNNYLEYSVIESDGEFSIKYANNRKQLINYNYANSNSNIYIIELNKFGIKEGRLYREIDGSYNKESYDIAYNNAEGFKKMFYYCRQMKYKNIILPYGDYSICYRNPKGVDYYSNNGWEIYIPSETIFDMNESTLRVIFDSGNKNPYDNSKNDPFRLNGGIFKISNTTNTTIKNGTLIGSKPERSFKNPQEKTLDYGVGIDICDGSRYTKIENMIIKGFMADGIATTPTSAGANILYCESFKKGMYDNNGLYNTNIQGTFTTELFSLKGLKYIQLTGDVNYSNFPNFASELYRYNFFDKDKKFISKEVSTYLQTNIVPYNAEYVAITIYGEDKTIDIIKDKNYRVSGPIPEFLEIRNCDVIENHRGGIANLANDTLIEFCNIKNNGNGKKEGKPQFTDTTRYAINCEDNVSRSVTVRNCNISDHFNSILVSSLKFTCDNNIIANGETSAVVIYECLNATITNNMIDQCPGGLLKYAYPDITRKRIVNIENNTCYGCSGYNAKPLNQNIIVNDRNNIFRNERIEIENVNQLKFFGENATTQITNSKIAGIVKNNYVEFEYLPNSTHNLSIDLSEKSIANIFNLGELQTYIYNIYGTEINNGKLKVNLKGNEKNFNINIRDSILSPKLFEAEYLSSGDYNINISFKNSIINDLNMQYLNSNANIFMNFNSLSNLKYINSNILFENCTINLLNADFLLRIANSIQNSSNININIIFKNCEINLGKEVSVFYNNSIKLPNLNLIMDNIIYKSDFRFNITGVGNIKIDENVAIIKKNMPPSNAPKFIGQQYIDLLNKKVYIAVGINTIEDWIKIN